MAHPKDADYPHPSSSLTTKVMKANKRSDTKPEVLIRSLLHRKGYRFRKDFVLNVEGRRCRPDVVFTKKKLAVFIDGCFWHYCPKHGHLPKSNVDYWLKKFEMNTTRDQLGNQALEKAGWNVMRIWEHVPPTVAVEMIVAELDNLNSQ